MMRYFTEKVIDKHCYNLFSYLLIYVLFAIGTIDEPIYINRAPVEMQCIMFIDFKFEMILMGQFINKIIKIHIFFNNTLFVESCKVIRTRHDYLRPRVTLSFGML